MLTTVDWAWVAVVADRSEWYLQGSGGHMLASGGGSLAFLFSSCLSSLR